MVCFCGFSMILPSCLLFQLMKRKRVRRKLEMTPLGNEVDGLVQVFVGAQQKSRRCFPKESLVLGKRIVGSFQKNRRC